MYSTFSTSASLLSGKIAPNFQNLWNIRGKMELVLLIDEDTGESQKQSTNVPKPIWTLRAILLNVIIVLFSLKYLTRRLHFHLNIFF